MYIHVSEKFIKMKNSLIATFDKILCTTCTIQVFGQFYFNFDRKHRKIFTQHEDMYVHQKGLYLFYLT